jgi:hypothetical protein
MACLNQRHVHCGLGGGCNANTTLSLQRNLCHGQLTLLATADVLVFWGLVRQEVCPQPMRVGCNIFSWQAIQVLLLRCQELV